MVLNNEDKILIKNLYLFENCSARKLIKEFPEKGWKLRTLNYFLKKLRESGCTGRKPGSSMQQMIIVDAIDEWRRLRACVRARGGHFQHLLQPNVLKSLVYVFFILVFHMHVKTGNNDDFTAYLNVTFNGRCLQVFAFYV